VLSSLAQEVKTMAGQLIECPCGTVLRGDDLDDVVSAAQAHAKTVHEMDLTKEQAESMARPG
jgi:predicted small metal-binding protein